MKHEQKINTIIFDAGGVLFETKIRRGKRIKAILKSLGFDEETIDHAIDLGDTFCREYHEQGKWPRTWEEEKDYWNIFYSQVVRGLGIHNDTLKDKLFHLTAYFNNCELFPEVRGVLDRLYGKYTLGVISNAFPSMDWIFDLLDLRRYFHDITVSAFVNTYKPNLDIYEYSLNKLQAHPVNCLFIDDQEKNVRAAEELGMTGIHLDRKRDMDLKVLLK